MCLSVWTEIQRNRVMRERRFPRATFGDPVRRNFFPIFETIVKGKSIEFGTLENAMDAYRKSSGDRCIVKIDKIGSRAFRTVIQRTNGMSELTA